ncbi:MAG: hypothetical protein HY892_13335 [Deltaproteobacteria bacterium]|nr:hypothetical protein [Deltaproteobacteria bacterium]
MKRLLPVLAVLFLLGCAGEPKMLQMRDTTLDPAGPEKGLKAFEFPKGVWTGTASTEQASTLAQTFVNSHNMAMREFDQVKENQEKMKGSLQTLSASAQKLEEANQKMMDSAQKNQAAAEKTLLRLEKLSKDQGTGEITFFYPVGVTQIKEGSLEYNRLVQFVDYLARESRGRKVLFVSIGSASAFGPARTNLKLANKRSGYPVQVIDKYLVNVPHEFYKVYGVGDLYSPKGISKKEHQRYQNSRLIAVYETDQVPTLPEEAKTK